MKIGDPSWDLLELFFPEAIWDFSGTTAQGGNNIISEQTPKMSVHNMDSLPNFFPSGFRGGFSRYGFSLPEFGQLVWVAIPSAESDTTHHTEASSPEE